ncbi:MAG: HlyD family efflux transporter periplasmic adaptor subunit [Actinomycetia bacterium]|nr:HlyD family efflux transporter periplasmic adaptor subunit [Actinomycetes bacterium]
MSDVDIDALIGRRSSKRGWLLSTVALVVVAAGVGAFLLFQSEESETVVEPPQAVEASTGQLSTTVTLSGSAVAERSTDLSFEAAGTVASVTVESGRAVQAGDTLATLDDADAQVRIETAEVQLRLAQLRLEALLADPAVAEIASAKQSIEAAESQVTGAEQALEQLSEPPTASELASAEQAVASALGQLSTAEETLAQLSEPPTASDLASAEQAVASALGQLSSAEEALESLVADPSQTEVASARSAVTAALADLTNTDSGATASRVALEEAFDEYCQEYEYLTLGQQICSAVLPLSDEEVGELLESIEGRSRSYERHANALANNNVAFILAEAGRQSAVTALSTAEEYLDDLLSPASDEDVRQAELAVEAARASHAAAIAQRQELVEEPTEEDRYQAELAVEAARASHAAAVAQLEELAAPPDESDTEQALSSLESALAGLDSAQAQYDELLGGETANTVAQQEQNVRLAEIDLEEAVADLADLVVVAPFDGIVEAVNVHPGDLVSPTDVAFSLSTTDRILIELTVTEADLLALEIGQAGLASFDGVEGVQYPVRIVSISRLPDAAQGVVTYDVEARILIGPEIAEVASQIAVLGGQGASEGAAALGATPGFGAGDQGGFGGGLLAGIELPEGVTFQDVIRALVNDEPLPEGVSLPEDFQIPPQILEFLEAGGLPVGGRQGADAEEGSLATRVLPAPGMSATVTILTELREESVLVPIAAVRQFEGEWFVAIPAATTVGAEPGFERVIVEVGESDGVNVEIISGLQAGDTILIGADNTGIAFSAARPQQQPDFGLAGFVPPGFVPPGFGGPGP